LSSASSSAAYPLRFLVDTGVFFAETFFAVDYFLADFLADALGVFFYALLAET